MFFKLPLLCDLLIISVALAAPSLPETRVPESHGHRRSAITATQYSDWMSGGIIKSSASNFSAVSAVLEIPYISGSDDNAMYMSVNLDVTSGCPYFMEAGIWIGMSGNETTTSAWHSSPDGFKWDNFYVNSGDAVRLEINHNGSYIEFSMNDMTINNATSYAFVPSGDLCRRTAEATMFTYTTNHTLPIPQFLNVSFTDIRVNGAIPSVDDMSTVILQQNGQDLTTVSVSDSSVVIGEPKS